MAAIPFIHFNDVYEISASKSNPCGGAARYASEKPVTFFSGDLFNPSITSTVTKGKHMIDIINAMNVDAAVIGNHDFDFGVETLQKYAAKCNFPWLLSNVNEEAGGRPLANAKKFTVLERHGHKIGVIGIVEREWLATIESLPPHVQYVDAVQAATELVELLRKEKGCDLVVCLGHMRWPRNRTLLENVTGIDLLLGGHDHFYLQEEIAGTWCLCSGSDFKQFTYGTIAPHGNEKPIVTMERIDVTRDIEEDPSVAALVESISAIVETKLDREIGIVGCELDARSATLRSRESNIGNLVADVARASFGADICILNSGTIRSNRIYPEGPFTLKDLLSILPFPDTIVVIEVTGKQVWQALENGVSQVPALEGRFPQVSGLSFSYTPTRRSGARIISVQVDGHELDLERKYTMATKTYLANGLDGYTCLKKHRVVVDEENGRLLPSLVRQHFLKLRVLNHLNRMDNLVLNAFKRGTSSPSLKFTVSPPLEDRIVQIKEELPHLGDLDRAELETIIRRLWTENAALQQKCTEPQ